MRPRFRIAIDRIQEFLAQESENPFAEYIQQREAESAHRYSFRQTDPDEAIYEGVYFGSGPKFDESGTAGGAPI